MKEEEEKRNDCPFIFYIFFFLLINLYIRSRCKSIWSDTAIHTRAKQASGRERESKSKRKKWLPPKIKKKRKKDLWVEIALNDRRGGGDLYGSINARNLYQHC